MQESGPLNIEGGKVMEMLVKMTAVLVKIVVMMMAPGSASGATGSEGERAPLFLLLLLP